MNNDWYFIAPKGDLLVGTGNVIYGISDGISSTKKITSLADAIRILTSDIESSAEVALYFYNAIAKADLSYPEDSHKLKEPQIRDRLPGIMLFLLDKEAGKKQAMVRYLKRGVAYIEPQIMADRKVFSNCINEFVLEDYYHNKKSYVSAQEKDSNLADILQVIYDAMLGAHRAAEAAAAEHVLSFNSQLQDKFGVNIALTKEPYLESEIKRFELQLLETLDRLAKRVEKLVLSGKKSDFFDLDVKSINPKQPLKPQIEERVLLETVRMKGRLKQSLDAKRQQAVGVAKYIWRSRDDDKVRKRHAEYDDRIFAWDNPPPGGHPGVEFGCRCWAEPSLEDINDPPIEPVYPEILLFPLGRLGSAIRTILTRMKDKIDKANKPGNPKDILNPNGKPIGIRGNSPRVRIEKGGEKAAKDLFDKLSKGGKPETPPGYPGKGTRLPNGDWVGHRPSSRSELPTVDLNVKDIPFRKIHFK